MRKVLLITAFLFFSFLSKGQTEIKKSGFTNITEANFDFWVKGGEVSFGIQTINGYLFNPYFSLGFGIGVSNLDDFPGIDGVDPVIPLFLDIRVNFLKKKVTPFFSNDAGYSLNAGPFVNPSLGMKFFVSNKTALNFSVGYKLQAYTYYFGSGQNYTDLYSFLNFKLGATF